MNTEEEILKILKKNGEVHNEYIIDLVGTETKNVLDLFMVAYKINAVSGQIDGPNELNEKLVLLQIEAFTVANLALKMARIPGKQRIILKIFIETAMADKL